MFTLSFDYFGTIVRSSGTKYCYIETYKAVEAALFTKYGIVAFFFHSRACILAMFPGDLVVLCARQETESVGKTVEERRCDCYKTTAVLRKQRWLRHKLVVCTAE